MCRLSEEHGEGTLQRASLDGVSLDMEQLRELLLARMPAAGTLAVTFRSQRRPPEDRRPLSKRAFVTVWTRCGAMCMLHRHLPAGTRMQDFLGSQSPCLI